MTSGRVAIVLILILSLSCTQSEESEAPFLLDHLKRSDYRVAFKSLWKLDSSRDYELMLDDTIKVPKQKRPVLFNIWYPVNEVSGSPMKYKGYFDISLEDPDFRVFSETLKEFALNVVANEIFGEDQEMLDSLSSEGFNRLMNTSTAAYQNQPYPKRGKFPLVIYHSGAQSSFDDNSVLCEYLASHGYVVIGSAFQNTDGRTLSVDSGQGSFEDIDFILDEAEKLDFIDTSQMTLIGHSLGAQMLLKYQAKGMSKAKTIIPIDATFENHSMYDDLFWSDVIGDLKINPAQFTNRFLAISGYDAFYQLYEKFEKTDRHYLSIGNLTHNEFIAQGVIRKKLLEELKLEEFESDKSYETVSEQYAYLCERIVSFISGNASESFKSDSLLRSYEIQLRGVPDIWNASQSESPTPRQHFALYEARGIDEALEVLKTLESTADSSPLFKPGYAYGIVFDLLSLDKIEEARKAETYFNRFNDEGVKKEFQRYIRLGERFRSDMIKDYFQSRMNLLETN